MSGGSDRACSVGFVGLGAMGTPMVTQLAAAGHEVLAHDVDESRVEELAGLTRVKAARTLGDLGAVDLAVCMLPDSDIVERVVAGPGGLLEVLTAGALIVDMSSSTPRRTVRLSEVVRAAGLELVDAPVSGGIARARSGELTVMFGGSEQQLERARPVLEALASTVVPVGAVGAGHAMKALNNVMSAVGLSVACEVIEVGRAFGLDPTVMLEVLNSSTGRNHATETKIERFVLSEDFSSGFLMRLMLKDLATAIDLAEGVGAATPIGSACLDLWREAAERLPADADQTHIAQVLARMRRG